MAVTDRPSRPSSSACTTKPTAQIAVGVRPRPRRLSEEFPIPPVAVTTPDAGACRHGSYLPVASCRSLLVLRRQCRVTEQEHLTERHGLYPVELSACNPTTGKRVVLPPHDVFDTSHALLDVSMASFKLLVVELTENTPTMLHVQLFSSEAGGWGDVLSCSVPLRGGCELAPGPGRRPATAVVVGDTVNWLCITSVGSRILSWQWRGGEHKTSLDKLPPSLPLFWQPDTCLAVLPAAADPRSVLSLIVLEHGEIEVWVPQKQRGGRRFAWEMRYRVEGTGAARPTGFGNEWLWRTEIVCFSPGSGALVLWGCESNNLLSLVLNTLSGHTAAKATTWDLQLAAEESCPYEIDLLSHMSFFTKTF